MKRLAALLFAALFGAVLPASAVQAGSVNLKRLTTEWSRAKKLADQSQEEGRKLQDELKTELATYEKLVAEGKALRESSRTPAKNEAEKIERQKKLRDLLVRAQAEQRRLDENKAKRVGAYQERYKKAAEELLAIIQQKVGEVARARGVTIVFDTSGKTSHNAPVLLFGPEEQDLTEEVLKALPQ